MIAIVLILFAAAIFSLQFKPVQTFVAKKAANYLSEELKTRVEVKSLYIKPFKSLVLEGLLVEDLEKDTLLFTPRLTVDINTFSIDSRRIAVNTAQLDNGVFHIKRYRDTTTNLEFIINYFDTGKTKPKTKPRRPYNVTFDKIILNSIAFRYQNLADAQKVNGVNFNDIHLKDLSATIGALDTKAHLAKAQITNLTFKEKSGFHLKNLTTLATIDSNRMEFKNLLLVTPDSRLTDYFLMKYKSFKDFGKFTSKVHLTANLKNSKLHFKDIAYFAPKMGKMDFRLSVTGYGSGYVDNFVTKNIRARAGQATYLSGNFKVKGLPYIGRTHFDLNFSQLHSNRRDADNILRKLTGQSKVFLPEVMDKFGNVSFKGSFTGLTNDFNAAGELKTRLGRVIADVNMRLPQKETPSYSGSIKAFDFNLQELLEQKMLGRTSFDATIRGRGFTLNQLGEDVEADVAYIDFKGYRYTNLKVNGSFSKRFFDGSLDVNDRNLKLNFVGNVDLNSTYPIFNFNSTIRGANLHVLNLVKDTLQVDADLSTNFSGNDIDNIQGNFQVRSARLTNTNHSFVVDSVSLTASGLGDSRSLAIKSDILDASIEGKYHLKTLPDYFKSLVKNYIPSMDLRVARFETQNFDFRLNLKDFEPISLLFVPQVKVPKPAVFNGRFASAENVATLNGFVPLVTYNKIRVNNLIIDESTSKTAMNIFITSDRIDLTDSLFIQNVNIANILKNDSLNLNVKLSDKDATNQLDLNGLVEFNTENFANLSLLPSDVIINRETWKVQEQVKFAFDKGKVNISNFELSRGDEVVTVNGTISNNPDDHLIVGFNKFSLTTFNPLTSPSGINLRGQLNGDIRVAAIGKAPHFDGSFKVDTLYYNNISIGDLTLKAGFDNSTKLVDVDVSILKDGVETMDVQGTYDANVNQQTLALDVSMKDNELIIFEPVLKKLVSNITGKVSADLQVTGKARNPRIDGTLSLHDAGVTVNYLKTHYRVTDEFKVDNSVIQLSDAVLRDARDNQATANGTVDMSNPNAPDIRVNIRARNFQALNTTAKDNPLYYGQAYATGNFRFTGPTNDMRIVIRAKAEEGTVFNIPLNAAETINETEFITFVAKDSTITPTQTATFQGLTMDFELEVDEKSEVNIITDLGRLSGRGDANLTLNITSFGDFAMFGEYIITKGRFDFTAQEVINKIFDIRQGGSIRWTGDPTDATINLKAVYGVRTSIQPLYTAAGRELPEQQRVLAEAVMNLNGLILKPDISFDLNFPNDAYIKDELQSYLSDVSKLNEQTLSLIVRRGFASGSGNLDIRDQTTSTLLSAGTELAFNKLNNIIAESLGLKYVDLNIRSLNEASASVRLLNGRLILTGGVTNDPRQNVEELDLIGGQVARDVEALYLLRPDGSLTLRASNRLNNRNLLVNPNPSENLYVSAFGLVYRQEFDTFDEFIRLLIGKKRREERRTTPPIQEPRKPSGAVLPDTKTSEKQP